MGVDYERLVFWEEMACGWDLACRWDLTGGKRPRPCPAPDWLDRERLKAALIALNPEDLPIGWKIDDIVEGVADYIYAWWHDYWSKTALLAGPSNKLRNLHKALSEWVDEHIDDREGHMLLRRDGADDTDAIIRLLRETGRFIGWFESRPRRESYLEGPRRPEPRRPNPPVRKEDPRTTFLTKLYDLYRDLSRKSGLSNKGYGPGMHFITECAALVGITVRPGDRQLILASIARAKMDT
jgi:hypothetical protein